MARGPETTVDTLDLGHNCLLTLTSRHLRGQIMRIVKEEGKSPITIKDQIDVLLSGIAGYTLEHENNIAKRIVQVVVGISIAIAGIYIGSNMASWGFWGIGIGALWALIGWFGNPDVYCFVLNILGSKTMLPITVGQTEKVRQFIEKLQNAKIAYEEE